MKNTAKTVSYDETFLSLYLYLFASRSFLSFFSGWKQTICSVVYVLESRTLNVKT